MISSRLFAEEATEHWRPYKGSLVIDGQGGSGVFYLKDDDPALAAELQAVRDSGLTGLIVSPAPQGRFWLNDAAFERSRETLKQWKARIEAHPDHFLHVQKAADLEEARNQRRLGII